jgi:hypothetical protein
MTRVEGVDIYARGAPLYATWVPVTWQQQAKHGKTNEGNKKEHQIQSVKGLNNKQQVIIFCCVVIKKET